MQQLTQKDLERRFVTHFLEVLGGSWTHWELRDHESPDFLVLGPEGVVGIEVYEIFKNPEAGVPRQAIEGGWRSLTQACEELWARSGHPKVEVTLHLQEAYHVTKKRVRPLARALVRLIAENLPKEGELGEVRGFDFRWGTYPKEFRSAQISRLVDYEKSHWHVAEGGWVGTLGLEKVQAGIEAKHERLEEYRKHAEEVWLLQVLHGWRISSSMDIPEETVETEYPYRFDRVYVFDTLRDQAHLLRKAADTGGNVR